MIIREINGSKCDGCGACEKACMGDVIHMIGGKAVIVYPEDCAGCMCCEIVCPWQVINVS